MPTTAADAATPTTIMTSESEKNRFNLIECEDLWELTPNKG